MLEITGILVLGITAQWIAWRLKIPAIFPLIVIGLAVGPFSTFLTPDGTKLINPDMVFEGKMMHYFISLAVGVILFEGGLTLKLSEIRQHAGTVTNLLIAGSIIMCIGGGLAAYYLLGLDIRIAFLFGALIIVTGPTVIAPILTSVHPGKNVAAILKWESILIDPIGALVAVLIFELTFGHGHEGVASDNPYTMLFKTFFLFISVGLSFGAIFGYLLRLVIVKKMAPNYLVNVIILSTVILVFFVSDLVRPESGLLAAPVMGFLLANTKTPRLHKIIDFKETITLILISVLFIILSSNIDIAQLELLGWGSIGVFLITVFILRPLAVFISSMKSDLNFKEKIFISWIGPKGIVAAAVASIFALYLEERFADEFGVGTDIEMLVPLTFTMILGTVTLSGLTAKPVANMLDIVKKSSNGFLLVGANEASVAIAEYLQSIKIPVTVVDNSSRNIKYARMHGVHALEENVISEEFQEELELEDVGRLLALTSSHDINIFAGRKFRQIFGRENVFRLITVNEMKYSTLHRPNNILFGGDADFIKLIEVTRHYPGVKEMKIKSQNQIESIIADEEDRLIPLFIRSADNSLNIITAGERCTFKEGDVLAYIGNSDSYN